MPDLVVQVVQVLEEDEVHVTIPQGVPGLSGPQGDVGPAGPTGATGAAGPAGADSTVPGPVGPAGPTGATGAAGTGGAYPVRGTLLYSDLPDSRTSWPDTFGPGGGAVPALHGGYQQSGDGATIAALTYDVLLDAGTWTFRTFAVRGPNLGRYALLLDGQQVGLDVDAYGPAAYSTLVADHGTADVATGGMHTLELRKLGTRNPSASGYFAIWSAIVYDVA